MLKILSCLFLLCSFSSFGEELVEHNKDLDYFTGTWSCQGHNKREYKGKKTTKAFKNERVVFRPIMKGFWLEGDYFGSEFINRCLYGKNGSHFMLHCYGNYEGLVTARSKGWIKDKLVFRGKLNYWQISYDEVKTFTKISPKEYRVLSTIENKDENYFSEFKATCLKK